MTDKTTATPETVDDAAAIGSRVQAVVGLLVCPHCGCPFSVLDVPNYDFGLTQAYDLTVKCPSCREIIEDDVPVPSQVQANNSIPEVGKKTLERPGGE